KSLSFTPTLSLNEGTGPLNHNWGGDGPGYGLPSDGFSARFLRTVGFNCGRYRFDVGSDDGVRVWVGDQQILDKWQDQTGTFAPEVVLSGGSLVVRVEYYEAGGNANLQVSWTRLSDEGCTHTLTTSASPANGGSVSASPPGPTYPGGTVVTLSATANSG